MRPLVIGLFVFLSLGARGQVELISLKREPVELPKRTYNIAAVVDARDDTVRVGVIQKGMLNKKVEANLATGCRQHLADYLKYIMPPQEGLDSVVLVINELKISEKTTMSSETGTLTYRYSFLLVHEGELFDILELHDAISEKGMDVTNKHESRIRRSLLKSLTRLSAVDFTTALTKPRILDSVRSVKVYAIQTAEKPVKGIYQTLDEFCNNSPSIVREFEIRRKSKGARVWLGTVENKPFYINESGERVKIKEDIWGFSDGNKCYIKIKAEYFELINRNGVFEYWGYVTMAEETGGMVGGLIGSIPQRTLFQLDLATGISKRN